MVWFEIRKVFSRTSGKTALAVMAAVLAVTCWLAVSHIDYVEEDGDIVTGIRAVRMLRRDKEKWEGYVTEDVLRRVIRENAAINASDEARSENVKEQNKAYAQKQGFNDIRDMINRAFCSFQEYYYYRVDSVTEEEVGELYGQRVERLREWLYSEEVYDHYTEEERAFLIERYETLETPFYYADSDGWQAVVYYAQTIVMIGMIVCGFLVSSIFSGEFQTKADAVFFSSRYGRSRATAAKVTAGYLTVTALYWIMVLPYSAIVLAVTGTGGGNCAIQTSFEFGKSFYHITFFELWLLTVFGGYIGWLFILTLTMLVSALTRSSVLAVMVPFIILFLPSFVDGFSALSDMLGLWPDQLLNISLAVRLFNLYRVGGHVTGALPVVFTMYVCLYLVLPPVLYLAYRRMK